MTRGRGVTVHRTDCPALARLDPERHIAAEWGGAGDATFPAEIVVDAADRTGLLRDISEVLSRERVNVTATRTQSSDLSARMRFTASLEASLSPKAASEIRTTFSDRSALRD